MNSKTVLIGVAAAAIAVLAIGAFFLLSSKQTPPGTTNNTQSESITEESTEPTTEPTGAGTAIELTSSGFSPKDIEIAVGTKVVWTNNSGKAAIVNAGPHPVHTSYSPLNLGSFNNGETLELVFDKAGTYSYHNHLSPQQGGIITVR